LARERGRLLRWLDGRPGLATIHPSAVLRMPDEASRSKALDGFVEDLRVAITLTKRLSADAG
jgi:uracil-DNA glycosylase